jgi:hypothetical protein
MFKTWFYGFLAIFGNIAPHPSDLELCLMYKSMFFDGPKDLAVVLRSQKRRWANRIHFPSLGVDSGYEI